MRTLYPQKKGARFINFDKKNKRDQRSELSTRGEGFNVGSAIVPLPLPLSHSQLTGRKETNLWK